MKKIIIFLILILAFNISNGQKNIKLKKEIISIPGRNFYIKNVIDGRADKNYIGYAWTGAFNIKNNLVFKHGLKNEFKNYFDNVLPKNKNTKAVVLKINDIWVSERIGTMPEIGKAKINIVFYEKENSRYKKIFETTQVYTEEGEDVSKRLENRIRAVIVKSLIKFVKRDTTKINTEYCDLESLLLTSSQEKHGNETQKNKKNKNKRYILNLGQTVGLNAFGWEFNYLNIRINDSSRWMFPRVMSVSVGTLRNRFFKTTGYEAFDMGFYTLGFAAIRKLNKHFNLHLQAEIPFGAERLINQFGLKSTHLFSGIIMNQELFFVSGKNKGLVIGLGLFEFFISSKVYKYDFGLKFKLGVMF